MKKHVFLFFSFILDVLTGLSAVTAGHYLAFQTDFGRGMEAKVYIAVIIGVLLITIPRIILYQRRIKRIRGNGGEVKYADRALATLASVSMISTVGFLIRRIIWLA